MKWYIFYIYQNTELPELKVLKHLVLIVAPVIWNYDDISAMKWFNITNIGNEKYGIFSRKCEQIVSFPQFWKSEDEKECFLRTAHSATEIVRL